MALEVRIAAAFLGALLIVAGIARQIESSRHRPSTSQIVVPGLGPSGAFHTTGWSTSAYDLVRIGGWALVIFGAVIVSFALVREIRKPPLSS